MEAGCKTADHKFLKAGEILFDEGASGKEVFVIVSGNVRITKKANGKSVVLAELGPGESVGEMSILLDKPRTATVEAITDCELIGVDRSVCLKCITNIPPCAAAMLQRLARRVGVMNENLLKERLKVVSGETAE